MKERSILVVVCILAFLSMIGIRGYVNSREDISENSQTVTDGKLENVWIIKGEGEALTALVDGVATELPLAHSISKIKQVVGDLELEQGVIQKIVLKEDKISGKVLAVSDTFMEIEHYGELPLTKKYKVYATTNGVRELTPKDVLVGSEKVEFVVAKGKICAALLGESAKASKIRVLINTTGYEDMYHKEVAVTADCEFVVKIGKNKTYYKKGDKVRIYGDVDSFGQESRIEIAPNKKDGRLSLLSVERADGNPAYRGKLELCWKKRGILIVNELPLEQYLYGVIGSEMPISYGEEALKVQAVCARSYAYQQMLDRGCGEYGAHVDDSIAYQVYNNTAETKETVAAVEKTKGEVLSYKGKVITAYYFSTSCGYTAKASDVWQGGIDEDYLEGGPQFENKKRKNLSSEKQFKGFIDNETFTSYDSEYPWYRWRVSMSGVDLGVAIEKNIKERYERNPDYIETKQPDGSYLSSSVTSIGKVKQINILERGESGIIKALEVIGSRKTIKVKTEYNIRLLLAPIATTIQRVDGSKVEGMSLLPSGFFRVEKKKDSFTFVGGGYGHGVGMSQNGAKTMAEHGYSYEAILKHYYHGTTIVSLNNM